VPSVWRLHSPDRKGRPGFCPIVGRCHRSNNVFLRIDQHPNVVAACAASLRVCCHDEGCKQPKTPYGGQDLIP